MQNASLRGVPSASTPHLVRNFCSSRPISVTSAIGTLNRLCASRHMRFKLGLSRAIRVIVAKDFLEALFFVRRNGIAARRW